MKNEQLAAQAQLAADILRDGLLWEYWNAKPEFGPPVIEWTAAGLNGNPIVAISAGSEIRIKPEAKVKPWKLPDPPAGKKWHRDDWTKEMLPDGYRPLLKGEKTVSNQTWTDEFHTASSVDGRETNNFWASARDGIATQVSPNDFLRTKRPLPVEPVMVQLEANDVPPGSVLRHPNWAKHNVYILPSVWSGRVSYSAGDDVNFETYDGLKLKGWQINRSISITGKWDADAWEKCEKEA